MALRFANVYGPYSGHKKGAITVFLRALHEGRSDPDLRRRQGFARLHVRRRHLPWYRARPDVRSPGGTVAHLATGVETSVSELADACRQAVGQPDHPIEYLPPRPGEVERNFATYDYARRSSGFAPSVDADEGLARTCEWYQQHVFDASQSRWIAALGSWCRSTVFRCARPQPSSTRRVHGAQPIDGKTVVHQRIHLHVVAMTYSSTCSWVHAASGLTLTIARLRSHSITRVERRLVVSSRRIPMPRREGSSCAATARPYAVSSTRPGRDRAASGPNNGVLLGDGLRGRPSAASIG